MKLDFTLSYAVTFNDQEKQMPVAMFIDLYEALSYARRMAYENMGCGRYEVSRVEGDDATVIYVPDGQYEGMGNYPDKNMFNMGNVSLIGDGNIPAGEGTASAPYLIASAAQLDWFSSQVNGGKNSIHGALTADITYNAGMDVGGYDGKSSNKFTPFTPIAQSSTGYKGVFDGRGNTISGIYVDRDDSPWCGLFGNVASGGVVKDVTIKNSYFRTSHAEAEQVRLGGIAGTNTGTVSGCDVRATIVAASDLSGIIASQIHCGGIVGVNYSAGTVSDCTSSDTVDVSGTAATNIYCGGIVGYNNGTVSGCTSSGAVDVSGTAATSINCGGIVGDNTGTVTSCAPSGSAVVSGTATNNTYCGGVAGYCDGTVMGCTSSGSVAVSGAAGSIYCGGVAGHVHGDGTVKDCVARDGMVS